MFLFDSLLQTGLEFLCERSSLIVLRAVLGSHDDLSEIAKINLIDAGHRCFGVVTPFCAAETGEKVLTDRFEHLWRNL